MKKRIFLIVCLLLIAVCGIVSWQNKRAEERRLGGMHELQHVLAYAEDKGEAYAADMLDYLIVKSYTKTELHKKWGTPAEIMPDVNKDQWELSEETLLAIEYDTNEEVKKIEVLPKQP